MNDHPSTPKRTRRSSSSSCPVVAVGASAGGLEALRSLFKVLPPGLHGAVVVLTHVPRDTPGHLKEVLGTFTNMPVISVDLDTPVQPGQVYIPALGMDLVIEKGILKPRLRDEQVLRHNIDEFLISLAADQGANSICVILSGAGSDGVTGSTHLVKQGGLVLVQNPSEASHAGMPLSAIQAGTASAVLPAAELGRQVARLLTDTRPLHISESEGIERALKALKAHTGYDFTGYRKGTLTRRIQKRMILAGMDDVGAYVRELEANPQECMQLFGSILIGVTEFFRDPEAFEALKTKALPGLFKDRGLGDVIRVWVCGCSTGEEAYSVAILLNEYMESANVRCGVKIFATDIDAAAIEVARKGNYPLRKQRPFPAGVADRYFNPERQGLSVVPFLRERIVMVHHNMLQDPPFLHMDLVVCRNMLIYLTHELQEKAISLLHESLNPGGYLFLGPAESMTPHATQLEVVDKRWKIFRSIGVPKRRGIPPYASSRSPSIPSLTATEEESTKETSPARIMEEALRRRYERPSVLVDRNHQVMHIKGDVSSFLRVPSGEPSLDILKMADPDLRHHLRMALREAAESLKSVSMSSLRYQSGGKRPVSIGVDPLLTDTRQLSALLIVFEPAQEECLSGVLGPSMAALSESGIIQRYEGELQTAYDQLRHVVEKDESLHEELRASNEELLSMNEELQSANEEMDASREELQSLNEELSIKLDELSKAHSFVENLLRSTNVATVFLDAGQRIVRSTPAALDVFHLTVEDQGRPIAAIKNRVQDDHLLDDIHQVMQGSEVVEREVPEAAGRCYLKRVYPFRTGEGGVEGVVMTYSDVTTLKEAEAVLRRGREELKALVEQRTAELLAARKESERRTRELEAIMEQTPAAIWITSDTKADVILGNPASYRILGLSQDSNVSKSGAAPAYRPTRDGEDIPVDQLPLQRAARGETVKDEEIDLILADGSVRTIVGNAVPLKNEAGESAGAVGVFLDFTALKMEREARRKSEALFQAFMDNSPAIAWMKDEAGRHVYLNAGYEKQFGVKLRDWDGKTDDELWPPEIAAEFKANDRIVLETGRTVNVTETTMDAKGDVSHWHNYKFLVKDAKGRRYVAGMGVDISGLFTLEKELRATAERLVMAQESANAGSWEWNVITNENIWSESVWTLYGLDQHRHPACYDTWKQAIHPDFRKEVEQEVLAALAEKREIYVEWRVNVPDRESWLVSRGKPILGPDGKVDRYMGVVMDITERKVADERLRTTLESIQAGFVALDSEWRYEYVNSMTEKLLGMKREDLYGKVLWDVFPDILDTELENAYRRAASGESVSIDYYYETWKRWYNNRCFPRPGGGMTIYFEDITRRKKTEQELSIRQEQFRLFAEHAPASIAMFDTDMRYVAVSNRWLEEYGLAGQNLIGRSHYEVFPEIPERWKAVHRRCLAGAVERADADPFTREDGTTQWISWEVRPWYKAKGVIGGMVVFSQDVSVRKNYGDFINASLQEKEVLLKEIHHRVKNNLQIIASLLSLREQTLDDPSVLDVLAESRSRVMSMALIHNQLYQSADFNEIDVKNYLVQLLPRLVTAYKGDKNIRLESDLKSFGLSMDQAIPFGLIMNELVTNALKHGFKDRDGGTLTVAVRIKGDVGEIEVGDDGRGLPEGFDMKAQKTLGLQIVGMLADQIHGTVTMESGEGTKVTLRFPLANPPTH